MITWHSSTLGDLTAHHQGLTIRIQPITDDTGRVLLYMASAKFRASAGWILHSTTDAIRHVHHMIDHLPVV